MWEGRAGVGRRKADVRLATKKLAAEEARLREEAAGRDRVAEQQAVRQKAEALGRRQAVDVLQKKLAAAAAAAESAGAEAEAERKGRRQLASELSVERRKREEIEQVRPLTWP